jgi:CubicO group peptidase (beta-lactamase class C family)
MMNSLLKDLFCAAISLLSTMSVSSQVTENKPDSIDNFLTGQMKKAGIPGLQLAVIKDGKIVKLAEYGLADVQDSVAVTRHTIFTIASITKAFTGIAVLQLVETGKLDLDKPVGEYLVDLPPTWQSIPVRQLLTHNSGIPNIMDNNTGELVGQTDSDTWAKVKAMPMEFNTGERFSYNQTNYALIARIIDKLSGWPFTKFITENQLKTVGMPSTAFFDARDVVYNSARNYSYFFNVGNARYRSSKIVNTYFFYPPFTRASAGLNTTAEELAKWVIALQNGRLLNAESGLRALWTPGRLNNGTTQGFSAMFNGYAIGWPAIIRPKHRAMAPIGAGNSAVFVYPDDNLSVIILTNLQGANPEEFADEVAGFYIQEMKAANGFGLPSAIKLLRAILLQKGFDQSPAALKELKAKDANYQLAENELDAWGWILVRQEKIKEALEIFKFNISLHPESANAYDSYAGELEDTGKNDEAVKWFTRALEINPKDSYAIGHLNHLRQIK